MNHCPLPSRLSRITSKRNDYLISAFQVCRSTLGYFDLEFVQLALPTNGCQTTTLCLPAGTPDLERTVILHHCMVRIPHRQEERLHELMLVALQPIVASLSAPPRKVTGFSSLSPFLAKPMLKTGGRGGALHREAVRVVQHAQDGLGIIRITSLFSAGNSCCSPRRR